jgi:hypothetical protein
MTEIGQRNLEAQLNHTNGGGSSGGRHSQRQTMCPSPEYYLYVPSGWSRTTLLVIMTTGAGDKLKEAFQPFADKQGISILSPMFPREDSNYSFLHHNGVRYDDLLLQMIQEAKTQDASIVGDKFLLYGFGAAAQFVNRFTFLHASKLLGVSMGDPTNVTQLDDELDWPLGTKNCNMKKQLEIDDLKQLQVHLFIATNTVKTSCTVHLPNELDLLEQSLNSQGVVTRKSIIPSQSTEEENCWYAVMNFFADTMKINNSLIT